MKRDRIESLVSWLWTGAILVGVGLFFLIRGWFISEVGMPPVEQHGALLDPQVALVAAVFFIILGVIIIAVAVVGKLRSQR